MYRTMINRLIRSRKRLPRICINDLSTSPASQRRNLVSAADLQFGQPLHETHPHLLQSGEVTPGITAVEYASRRDNLAQLLPKGGVAVLGAADLKHQSKAVFYEYHQDPDFFYLTGFNEPEALAVIEKTGNDAEHVFHLLVRPKDPTSELWEGPRSGIQAAQDVFNADEAGNIFQVSKILPEITSRARHLFVHIPPSNYPSTQLSQYLQKAPSLAADSVPPYFTKQNVRPLRNLLNELRVRKSPAEVANLRKVGKMSGRAITNVMRQGLSSEKEVAAFLEYDIKKQGCDCSGYVPVVAGGENALCIHYVRNDDVLRDGQLLLVDAGGEYGGYKSDITRTWPVNGTFSDPQKDLYDLVLNVQRTCVSLCRANANLTLDQLHGIAEKAMWEGLVQLGFDVDDTSIHQLWPHHLGHHVGLDVHDAPGYSRTKALQSGNCITIEPGVYVPDDERWPAHFRGIGIRIEDSVCVQDEDPLVLTTEAVKERVDIEALRRT